MSGFDSGGHETPRRQAHAAGPQKCRFDPPVEGRGQGDQRHCLQRASGFPACATVAHAVADGRGRGIA